MTITSALIINLTNMMHVGHFWWEQLQASSLHRYVLCIKTFSMVYDQPSRLGSWLVAFSASLLVVFQGEECLQNQLMSMSKQHSIATWTKWTRPFHRCKTFAKREESLEKTDSSHPVPEETLLCSKRASAFVPRLGMELCVAVHF